MPAGEGTKQDRQCEKCERATVHRRDNSYNGWTCTKCLKRNPDEIPSWLGLFVVVVAVALVRGGWYLITGL